jgi:beta-xylosidase
MRIRLRNERNILTIHTSHDRGQSWQKFGVQMEVSGYHHNVAYDFLSLRPALYAAGNGTARFRNFVYRGLM